MLKPLVELALRMDGLSYYGKITTYTDTTHFKVDGLAGWGDNFFDNWFVYVVRDSGGAGAAPQDELAKITSYTSSDGTFTHVAFTTPVAVNDEVLIVHKAVAAAIGGGGGGGAFSGDIEIWDSFEYPSDTALQAKWIHGGGAAAPVRENTPPSGAPYYENYCMEVAISGAGVGEVHRNFAVPKDLGTLRNISIAGQSDVALDTFRFMLIDSSGNDSYWTQTCTLANTWYKFDIDPHSTPTGTVSGTPVDLDDVVQIRLANMANGSAYYFDLIMFESLVASKIGIGYDGLDDAKELSSSVRGHLLAGLIHGTGTVIADNHSLADAIGHDGATDLNTGVMGQLQDYVTDDVDSIYGRLGAFTGPVGGAAQDDNVKASLDLAHIDLDAILADIGDASASTLGSLYAILGNPSASLATTILDGIDGRTNNPTLNALLGFPDIADLTAYRHILGTRIYDDFNDNTKDTDIWDTDTTAGSTTISETSNVTRFANPGTGTAGYSYRPTVKHYGKSMVIEADITLTTGTGTSNEAFIELYQDANNYFRFGFYRSAATDSRGRIAYNIAGSGLTTTDVDTTDTDAVSRNYRIVVDEHNVHVYLERQLLGTIAFEQLTDYIVRMEAGTTGNADTLQVDFDNFLIHPYREHDLETYRRIESVQGGSESIQTVWNTLNNMLDLARHPDSGYTAMDGTEVTLISIAAQDTPFEYSGATIKTHMLQAGDTVIIKPYAIPRSGGSYNNPLDIITLTNAQTQDVNLPSFYNQFGIKVTAEQTSSHGIDSAQAYDADGAPFTDETAAANNATANDMTLLPAAPAVGDAYYFGCTYPFGLLRLNIGTQGGGTWTVTWKYWNGSAWTALAGVTDGTTHFRAAAGSHDVTFTIPTDWTAVAVNGVTAYYIMADLTAFTNLTAQPLGTQAWTYLAMLTDHYDARR